MQRGEGYSVSMQECGLHADSADTEKLVEDHEEELTMEELSEFESEQQKCS